MWGKVIQTLWCNGCHMSHQWPHCTACEFKAGFDISDREFEKAWQKFFSPSPLFLGMFRNTLIFKHPSRWREEHYSGKTIRVPLLYG